MAGTAPWTVPPPRRARDLIPAALPRRRELIAVCAVGILAAHLLLAQLTLVLALAFAVVGRASRWRLWWLTLPAAAGLAWTVAVGPGSAIAGFTAGPSAILWHLGGGHLAGEAAQPLAGFGGAQRWLPRQFPVALLAGAAEAALIGWLAWLHTDEWAVPPPRPGVIAAARRAIATRTVRAGAVVTREGCALGVVTSTGAIAELRWTEAVHGTLVAGAAAQDVTLAGLQLVHAALRRRKPVIVLDFGGDPTIARTLAAACLATGVPLRIGGSRETAGSPETAGYTHGWGRSPVAIREPETPGASALWGRSAGTDRRPGDPAPADLGRVLREREAALLVALSPEQAGQACADLASFAGDLRRIGVDGDAVIWVPRGERVPAAALGELLGLAPDAGLAAVIGTTSPAAATELSALAGTLLIHRVSDQGLAASLAARTGTRLLPRSLAGSGYLAGAASAGTTSTGTPTAAPDADLVPSPAVAARTLLTLGRTEFVLAASRPRQRIIAPGQMVPARLPRGADGQPDRQPGSQTGRPPGSHLDRQTSRCEAGT